MCGCVHAGKERAGRYDVCWMPGPRPPRSTTLPGGVEHARCHVGFPLLDAERSRAIHMAMLLISSLVVSVVGAAKGTYCVATMYTQSTLVISDDV